MWVDDQAMEQLRPLLLSCEDNEVSLPVGVYEQFLLEDIAMARQLHIDFLVPDETTLCGDRSLLFSVGVVILRYFDELLFWVVGIILRMAYILFYEEDLEIARNEAIVSLLEAKIIFDLVITVLSLEGKIMSQMVHLALLLGNLPVHYTTIVLYGIRKHLLLHQ